MILISLIKKTIFIFLSLAIMSFYSVISLANEYNGEILIPAISILLLSENTNIPPVVDAGLNQTILLPKKQVQLTATVSDDGLPAGSTLTYLWNRESGPGDVTFSEAETSHPIASFDSAGSYILKLSVSDGTSITSDSVTINVIVESNYYVDINNPSCSDGNSGTSATPFCSISKAVEVAAPGDHVSIKEGVYRENIIIEISGTDANPIVFAAYNDDKVVVDGSVIVNGWTRCASAEACFDNPNWLNIYYTTIDYHTDKLFENNTLMTNAREPDFGYFASTKSQTDISVYSGSITESSDYYVGAFAEFQGTSTTAAIDWNNLVYDKYYVTNSTPGRMYFDYSYMTALWGHSFDNFLDEMWFYIRNKVQYIDRPGEWALLDYLAEAPYTIYFWAPSGAPNSNLVEAAFHNNLITGVTDIENIQFIGIDLSKVNKYPALNNGGAYTFRGGARNIIFENSTISFAEKAFEIRNADGLIIRNNNLVNNYDAIVLGSGLSGPVGTTSMSYIEENNIGPNDGDGIQIYSESNITIRNNHIHHHLSDRKHSDNIQARSAQNIFVENNTINDGGQNIIMQETVTATINNNLVYNSHARSLILDSHTNQNLEVIGNTFGFSNYSHLIRFSNTILKNNIYLLGEHLSAFFVHDYLERIDCSDYNYYADYISVIAHGNPWTSYSFEDWRNLGFDQNSFFGGSSFANIPLGFYIVEYFYDRDDIKINNADTIFSIGDIIEYANDGISRSVTSIDHDSIGIDPPLDYDNVGSLWGNYVIHWGNHSIDEDYTPSGDVCSGSGSGNYLGAVPCD